MLTTGVCDRCSVQETEFYLEALPTYMTSTKPAHGHQLDSVYFTWGLGHPYQDPFEVVTAATPSLFK